MILDFRILEFRLGNGKRTQANFGLEGYVFVRQSKI